MAIDIWNCSRARAIFSRLFVESDVYLKFKCDLNDELRALGDDVERWRRAPVDRKYVVRCGDRPEERKFISEIDEFGGCIYLHSRVILSRGSRESGWTLDFVGGSVKVGARTYGFGKSERNFLRVAGDYWRVDVEKMGRFICPLCIHLTMLGKRVC